MEAYYIFIFILEKKFILWKNLIFFPLKIYGIVKNNSNNKAKAKDL